MPALSSPHSFRLMPFSSMDGMSIDGSVEVATDGVILRYRLKASTKIRILVPERAASPTFLEGLWNQTCFECFVSRGDDAKYLEWNLAPSGHWATFAYAGYRQRLPLAETELPAFKPEITVECPAMTSGRTSLTLCATLPMSGLRNFWGVDSGPFVFGISAVVATRRALLGLRRGPRSYWALVHERDIPDFHVRSSFILELGERTKNES